MSPNSSAKRLRTRGDFCSNAVPTSSKKRVKRSAGRRPAQKAVDLSRDSPAFTDLSQLSGEVEVEEQQQIIFKDGRSLDSRTPIDPGSQSRVIYPQILSTRYLDPVNSADCTPSKNPDAFVSVESTVNLSFDSQYATCAVAVETPGFTDPVNTADYTLNGKRYPFVSVECTVNLDSESQKATCAAADETPRVTDPVNNADYTVHENPHPADSDECTVDLNSDSQTATGAACQVLPGSFLGVNLPQNISSDSFPSVHGATILDSGKENANHKVHVVPPPSNFEPAPAEKQYHAIDDLHGTKQTAVPVSSARCQEADKEESNEVHPTANLRADDNEEQQHQEQQTGKAMDIDVNLHTDSSGIPTHTSNVEPGPSHRVGVLRKQKIPKGKKFLTLKTRSNLKMFVSAIERLSDKQKECIKGIGFGHLLELKIQNLPLSLSYWLVDNFDANKCSLIMPSGDRLVITDLDVHISLGLPMGRELISKKSCKENFDVIKEWRASLLAGEMIQPSILIDKLINDVDAGDQFKLNFAVLLHSLLLDTHQSGHINQSLVRIFTGKEDFKEFNWCAFLLECLVDSKKSWEKTKKGQFRGPVLFLNLFYVDRVKLFSSIMFRRFARSISVFIGLTSAMLRQREKDDIEAGAFGFGLIQPRQSIPSYETRNTETTPTSPPPVEQPIPNNEATPIELFIQALAEKTTALASAISEFASMSTKVPSEFKDNEKVKALIDEANNLLGLVNEPSQAAPAPEDHLPSYMNDSPNTGFNNSQHAWWTDPTFLDVLTQIELAAQNKERMKDTLPEEGPVHDFPFVACATTTSEPPAKQDAGDNELHLADFQKKDLLSEKRMRKGKAPFSDGPTFDLFGSDPAFLSPSAEKVDNDANIPPSQSNGENGEHAQKEASLNEKGKDKMNVRFTEESDSYIYDNYSTPPRPPSKHCAEEGEKADGDAMKGVSDVSKVVHATIHIGSAAENVHSVHPENIHAVQTHDSKKQHASQKTIEEEGLARKEADVVEDLPAKKVDNVQSVKTVYPRKPKPAAAMPTRRSTRSCANVLGDKKEVLVDNEDGDGKREHKPAASLRSPYYSRFVDIGDNMSELEKVLYASVSRRSTSDTEPLFRANTLSLVRANLRSLEEDCMVSPIILDAWASILNHKEQYRSDLSPSRLFLCIASSKYQTDDVSLSQTNNQLEKFCLQVDKALYFAPHIKLKTLDMIVFGIYANDYMYMVVFNLKTKITQILDVSPCCDEPNCKCTIPTLVLNLIANLANLVNEYFLKKGLRAKANVIIHAKTDMLKLPWAGEDKVLHSGICTMRQMETFMGTAKGYKCGFEPNSEKNISKLRLKYLAEIICSDVNEKRREVVNAARAHAKLTMKGIKPERLNLG